MHASHSIHLTGEYGLNVAVQASLHFIRGLLGAEPEFHFDVHC